jgi:predicted Ser/Thr protein kinase
VCPGCTKRIEPGKGKVVKALGFYYHQECFVCITCKTPLSGKFYTANGKPLCAEHSGKQKSRQPCPVCLKPLGQDKMLMWGRYYHKTCLECRLCKKPLLKQDKTYAVREGDAQLFLCERDYKIAHSKWCMACGEPIVGEMVFINKGEYYHQACFQCKTCCKKIDTYLCVAGELRCSDHTSASQADCTCSGCGQEIEHNKIFAVVGKKFHKDCLKCKFCSKELEPVQCRLRDGLLSCANCLLEYSLSLDQSSPSSAPSQNTPPSRLRASEIDSERIRSRSVGLTEAKQGQNRRILAKVTTHKDKSLPSPGQKSNRRETSSELASSLRESSNSILSHGTEEKDEYSGPESSASPISRRSNLLNSPSRRVNMSNFKKGELIGKGQFGKVYVALLENGQWIAVKQMDIKSEEDEAHVKAMEKEVFLMEKLRHENIVSLLGTHRDGAHFYILMEYVAGKSLDVLLKNVGPFPEVTIRWYTLQLVRALAYMHMHGIVHRDIKGKNILVDTNGTLKLADFGSAKQLDSTQFFLPNLSN